jgi:hypothetical protein
VILQENSNVWNLSPVKEGSSKKRKKEQGLKSKGGETSFEKLHVFKRRKEKENEIYKLLGEILLK